jgi:hypothetical protein
MLLLKDGVQLNGNKYINAILTAVQTVFDSHGWLVTVTAGRDGHEGKVSYHNDNRALDIRFWDVPAEQRRQVGVEIAAKLPPYYDVLVETNHFHIEADAKKEGLGHGPI